MIRYYHPTNTMKLNYKRDVVRRVETLCYNDPQKYVREVIAWAKMMGIKIRLHEIQMPTEVRTCIWKMHKKDVLVFTLRWAGGIHEN